MPASNSVSKSLDIAEKALSEMAKRGIPATPQNYTLWYDHTLDRNPGLRAQIELMEEEGRPFTEEACSKLYHDFYSFDEEAEELRNASAKLQMLLQLMISQLAEAGENTEGYSNSLQNLSGELNNVTAADKIERVVTQLLSETASITEKNKLLQQELNASSDAISTLQSNLEEARTESVTDALTKIGNRRLFDEKLLECSNEAAREETELCLLLIDIDHFKAFNDTHGHRVGDEVLKFVGARLKQMVKGQDIPARYGGEEFACILPETGIDDASTLANSIREAVSKQVLRNKKTEENFGRITISIGVSKYAPGEALEAFINRADEALYRAKDQGRNRVMKEIS
ncbi:GGDEF domain-containing protein [Kiloniella sp. b19]|uniref:GGDEF domain-containing protein n=1 Tax=Kiloniella sp. GXU_MW_B19 TaxID=3141326 RepID=UPI0031DA1F6E